AVLEQCTSTLYFSPTVTLAEVVFKLKVTFVNNWFEQVYPLLFFLNADTFNEVEVVRTLLSLLLMTLIFTEPVALLSRLKKTTTLPNRTFAALLSTSLLEFIEEVKFKSSPISTSFPTAFVSVFCMVSLISSSQDISTTMLIKIIGKNFDKFFMFLIFKLVNYGCKITFITIE